jgi:hypothetical protein
MKNVTITLEEQVAAWIRVEAAKAGKSVSRYIGERLAEDMRQGTEQLAALDRFLSGPGWRGVAKDLPKRDELYDRPGLHRHQPAHLQPRSRRAGKKG